MSKKPPRRFRVELEAAPGKLGEQSATAIRSILQVLSRSFGLTCVQVVRLDDDDQELPLSGEDS